MRKTKKRISLIIAITFIYLTVFSTSTEVLASTVSSCRISKNYDINDIIKNPEQYPNIEIEGPYSLEEMAHIMAIDENIKIEEAKDLLTKSDSKSYFSQASEEGYLTFKEAITVTALYSVQVRFYCKMEFYGGGPEPTAFINVSNVTLDRAYIGGPKEFDGEIYYNLESSTRLYYEIEGDFWNYGTTKFTGGGSVGIGVRGKLEGSVEYASSHFRYLSPKQGYFRI